MTIYFAINEYDDMESHFDLEGVYFSKEDLLKDLKKIKRNGYAIYSINGTRFLDMDKSKGHNSMLVPLDIKEFEKELKEQEEYDTYLKLKEKFEKSDDWKS